MEGGRGFSAQSMNRSAVGAGGAVAGHGPVVTRSERRPIMTQHDVPGRSELVHTGIPGLDEVLCGACCPARAWLSRSVEPEDHAGSPVPYTGIRQFAEPG